MLKNNGIVELFVRTSCASSRKAQAFFAEHNIPHRVIFINKEELEKETIQRVLFLTEGVTEEAEEVDNNEDENVTDRDEAVETDEQPTLQIVKKNRQCEIAELTMAEFLNMAVTDTDLLRTPFAIQGDKCYIGYNEDEYRVFLPRKQKQDFFNKTRAVI